MSVATAKRPRLKAEDRRARFLEDAASIIDEDGLESLTMENLAARSDVNKALPYRFFANRDDVLVALFDAENLAFDELLNKNREGVSTFREEVSALVNTWMTSIQKKMSTPSLATARTLNGALEAKREARLTNNCDFIEELITTYYDIPQHRARMCASVLLAGAQGFSATLDSKRFKKADLVETYINMIVGGVEATLDQ